MQHLDDVSIYTHAGADNTSDDTECLPMHYSGYQTAFPAILSPVWPTAFTYAGTRSNTVPTNVLASYMYLPTSADRQELLDMLWRCGIISILPVLDREELDMYALSLCSKTDLLSLELRVGDHVRLLQMIECYRDTLM